MGGTGTNVMTETEQLPPPASLVISPNLQALLEFDNRLRMPGESGGPPAKECADVVQPGQCASWREQGVPTVSLPPPRRKKSAVAGVPISPRTTLESESMTSPTGSFPEANEISGEIEFARPEDVVEGERGSTNPYLNSPPSPPRYFYPRSEDEEEGIDQNQPRAFYTLEKSRSMKWPDRQRSFSGPSPVEHKGGQLASRRYFTSLVRNVGSRPKEKGLFFGLTSPLLSQPYFFKGPGPRATTTRPLLLHSHKASHSSSHSHQVRLPLDLT